MKLTYEQLQPLVEGIVWQIILGIICVLCIAYGAYKSHLKYKDDYESHRISLGGWGCVMATFLVGYCIQLSFYTMITYNNILNSL